MKKHIKIMEIEEDYVSFEVAKLLNEKGFEQYKCQHSYDSKGVFQWSDNLDPYECSAPTLQMACAWVRSKGYSIEIHATAYGWIWNICKINGTDICWSEDKGPNSGGAWDDYDECTESALKYSLENLIL